jgi:stearoyl-CoA desaturase (delta-9 desaturase)
MGTAALQRGPLWWAAHHRHHHPNADTEKDIHSPRARNLWWSHVGWLLCPKYDDTKVELVKDLLRYPELQWIDRYFLVPPATLALTLWVGGALLNQWFPGLHTSGVQMLIYGFVLSTVLLYHATFCVNSVAHKYGSRRFLLRDESRNNLWVALVTLGEGWHNNHHYYPASARQGFFWWEIDVTFYVLKGLDWWGIIWEAKEVPSRIFRQAAPTRDIRSGSV